MTYGVTAAGFVKKTLAVLQSETSDDYKDNIGNPNLNFQASTPLGNFNNVISDRLADIWDAVQAVYSNGDPNSAEDQGLEAIGAITGAYRLAAAESTVTLDQLFVDASTTIPAGKIVSVDGVARFKLLETAVNAETYPTTISATAESVETGTILGYANQINKIETPVSGWNQNAALTNDTAGDYVITIGMYLDIEVDEAVAQRVTWGSSDTFTAAEVVDEINDNSTGCTAEVVNTDYIRISTDDTDTGNSIKLSGTVNTILDFDTTLVKGFNSVDATVGRDLETNPEFRLRRISLLRATGRGTVEAIRANILTLTDVEYCIVYENYTTDNPDTNGLPPKSFEALVEGGTAQDIYDMIWLTKPAGIEPHGDNSGTSTDTSGNTQIIKYSDPDYIPIYIEYAVTVDADLFPSNGDDQIKAALKAFGDSLGIGEDVIALPFKAIPLTIAGVLDVTAFLIDDVDPPVASVNITVAFNELATFALTDIEIYTP